MPFQKQCLNHFGSSFSHTATTWRTFLTFCYAQRRNKEVNYCFTVNCKSNAQCSVNLLKFSSCIKERNTALLHFSKEVMSSFLAKDPKSTREADTMNSRNVMEPSPFWKHQFTSIHIIATGILWSKNGMLHHMFTLCFPSFTTFSYIFIRADIDIVKTRWPSASSSCMNWSTERQLWRPPQLIVNCVTSSNRKTLEICCAFASATFTMPQWT